MHMHTIHIDYRGYVHKIKLFCIWPLLYNVYRIYSYGKAIILHLASFHVQIIDISIKNHAYIFIKVPIIPQPYHL